MGIIGAVTLMIVLTVVCFLFISGKEMFYRIKYRNQVPKCDHGNMKCGGYFDNGDFLGPSGLVFYCRSDRCRSKDIIINKGVM